MGLKVKEARHLYCPFVKNHCLADKCMMWREYNWVAVDSKGDVTPIHKELWQDMELSDGGYCALAGKE